jgi:tol-pal system protein YbgF
VAKIAAMAIVTFAFVTPGALAAQSVTVDARELLTRMQRMERDIRDLQAETFRRPPGAPALAPAPAPPAAGAPATDLEPIMRRLDEFGSSISRLTGQLEELNHQVDLLAQKTDRLQKDLDFQAQQAAQARTTLPPVEGAAASPPANAVALLPPNAPAGDAPQEGVLGQIPADAAPSSSSAPSDAKSEFDAAMALLSRAQYVPARDALRSFIDNNPDDERIPAALYWSGDIAYSATKNYDEAARNFAELLKRYPASARAPEGMLKLGLVLMELGQTKEGCAALAALPAKYPAASPAIATRARNALRDNKCR